MHDPAYLFLPRSGRVPLSVKLDVTYDVPRLERNLGDLAADSEWIEDLTVELSSVYDKYILYPWDFSGLKSLSISFTVGADLIWIIRNAVEFPHLELLHLCNTPLEVAQSLLLKSPKVTDLRITCCEGSFAEHGPVYTWIAVLKFLQTVAPRLKQLSLKKCLPEAQPAAGAHHFLSFPFNTTFPRLHTLELYDAGPRCAMLHTTLSLFHLSSYQHENASLGARHYYSSSPALVNRADYFEQTTRPHTSGSELPLTKGICRS